MTDLADVLGRDPGPHTVTPLLHNTGNPVTAGIWRYAGEGWSVVHKRITRTGSGVDHWASSDTPDHWNYWAREPNAYQSALTANAYADAGIRGPNPLAAFDRPDGVDLWLEDVVGTPGDQWDIDTVTDFATRLGRGQGSYLAGRPLPDVDWLSRRWLRQYVASKPVDGSVLYEDAAWQQPGLADAFRALRPRLIQLWEDREILLSAIEALPQTLTHSDVWPKNLIESGGDHILLDWASVGVGAIAEDAANLVPDCFWDGFLPMPALDEVAERVWTGYLDGLRDAGWVGDERAARLGFTAAGAVKYAWLAEHTIRRLQLGELKSYGGYSQLSVDELFETYAGVFNLLLDWADEAHTLIR